MDKTSKDGLSEQQVRNLKLKFGDNTLPEKEKENWFTILISQFKNPLIYLLLAIGLLSLYFGEVFDTALIVLVALFNVVMGFFQEYSAQKTLSALKKIIRTTCVVIRDGKRKEIETKDIVPGDLVIISSGDRVPADGKIIKGQDILVNEAILTGEEESVSKSYKEDESLMYMGTTIIYGQGIMLVEKIATETKIGKIGLSLSEIEEEETPLQKRLRVFTKYLIILVVGICLAIFILGIVKGGNIWQTFRISIVLSIAAIPEGLPIAITVILALGMRKILKRKGLIKKLLSIETLGSTSVICIDKTGTLTEGKMQVVKTSFVNRDAALLALTLLNDRKAGMEIAIWNYLQKETRENPDIIFNSYERIYDEPFDSAKKYKVAASKIDDKITLFIMGAPEIIINFCKFTPEQKKILNLNIEIWAKQGLRIIGIAGRQETKNYEKKDLDWLGLIAIEDPLRKEASDALRQAYAAGMDVKIVTGDYLLTAITVAKKIGMKITPKSVMDFDALEMMSDETLEEKIGKINLFARVTPLQKLRIIKALQKKGEIVAMTGDGVNDAPALKKANIGVAVDNATDVAKESSDLILLDSNFQTIIAACEEGRLILSNIKKVVGYVLSNSFAEIVLISGSLFLNLSSPLTVAQILWIHLICDGPPDIMLGFEPKEKGIMKLNPREIRGQQILTPTMKFLIFIISSTVGLSGLAVFWFYSNIAKDIILGRSITFAILASVSMVYIFAFKNLKKLIIQTDNFFENKYLLAGVFYGFSLILLAIYNPFLNKILNTVPLSLNQWIIVGSVSILSIIIIELSKIISIKIFKQTSI